MGAGGVWAHSGQNMNEKGEKMLFTSVLKIMLRGSVSVDRAGPGCDLSYCFADF